MPGNALRCSTITVTINNLQVTVFNFDDTSLLYYSLLHYVNTFGLSNIRFTDLSPGAPVQCPSRNDNPALKTGIYLHSLSYTNMIFNFHGAFFKTNELVSGNLYRREYLLAKNICNSGHVAPSYNQ
jgi:hypothetical protein